MESDLSFNIRPTAAAYIRVSTDDQTELSPDAQLRMIREAAESDGFQIPNEYIFLEQRGVSGRHAQNRPAFQHMIALAKSQNPPPFRRLYVWKFSRFARNQEESIFYKGILRKKCGVDIKSVSEPIMEGMFGRLIETIIEWFDEYYSVNLSEEVLRGMTEKALRHGYQTSPCLGYRAVGEGKPFVIVEEEIAAVEYIFEAFHQGTSMGAIAKELNAMGIRTKRGSRFDRRAIGRILQNPFYKGTVRWNGYSFQGSHEVRKSLSLLFEENQKLISDQCQQPQNMLTGNENPKLTEKAAPKAFRPIDRNTYSHWLSGLLFCGRCGSALTYNRARRRRKNQFYESDYFQCWKYSKGLHQGSCSLSVKKLEALTLASLGQFFGGNPDRQNQKSCLGRKTSWEPLPTVPMNVALKKNAWKQFRKKERRIRDAYEQGADSLEEYKKKKAELEQDRRLLMETFSLYSPAAIPTAVTAAVGAASAPPVPISSAAPISSLAMSELSNLSSASGQTPPSQSSLPVVESLSQLLSSPAVPDSVKAAAARRIFKKIIVDRAEGAICFCYNRS